MQLKIKQIAEGRFVVYQLTKTKRVRRKSKELNREQARKCVLKLFLEGIDKKIADAEKAFQQAMAEKTAPSSESDIDIDFNFDESGVTPLGDTVSKPIDVVSALDDSGPIDFDFDEDSAPALETSKTNAKIDDAKIPANHTAKNNDDSGPIEFDFDEPLSDTPNAQESDTFDFNFGDQPATALGDSSIVQSANGEDSGSIEIDLDESDLLEKSKSAKQQKNASESDIDFDVMEYLED